MSDEPSLLERARYAIEHGNSDQLHQALVNEIGRMHVLIQRGLAYGDQFKTPLAAGARAELRAMAGMNPAGTHNPTGAK